MPELHSTDRQQTAAAYEGQINTAVMVTSPSAWLALVGGVLVVAGILFWACCSWLTSYVTAPGIYHPGASDAGEVVAIVPLAKGKTIQEGMEATIYLSDYNQQEYGHMKATVTYVDPYTCSVDQMQKLLQDDLLVSEFSSQGPSVSVVLKLQEDPASENGYYWSAERGGSLTVNDGSLASVSVAVKQVRPITVGIPALEQLLSY